MAGAQIFISYSHADERWKERLLEHLAPLVREGRIEPWDVGDIAPGDDLGERVEAAISGAKVGVFLVSASFLASSSIQAHELPRILKKHTAGGLVLVPVMVRACAVEQVAWLSTKQRLPRSGRAIAQLTKGEQDVALTEVAREIASLVPPPSEPPSRRHGSEPPGRHYNPQWYVPHMQKEELVLGSLRFPGAPIIVTAPPASGKSTLIWHLVRRLREEHPSDSGAMTVIPVDLGGLTDAALDDPTACLHELATLLAEAYASAQRWQGSEPTSVDSWVESAWKQPGTPERRLKRMVERQMLGGDASVTVLVLDRFDRLVGKPAGNPVARMLRAWMENRDQRGPWASLRLLLAARGTSLYFHALDELSELFSAALHVRVDSFNLHQLHCLVRMYGGKWTDDEVEEVLALVDGQPYFSRLIFFLEAQGTPKAELLDIEQLKLEHCAGVLRQIWFEVSEREHLRKPLCALLHDPSKRLSADENARLYQAGFIRRTATGVRVSNPLLASYIKERC